MNNIYGKKIEIPAKVGNILRILRRAGFEAFIVGGCVRDSILGRDPKDWDITTSALPQQVKSLFYNTVDTGIRHGTVMVLMGGEGFEVTTYRKDGIYSDNRRPDSVEFTPSLEEDLKRRDFTINAFAYNEERGIVDLFGGMKDLENKVIRCVRDPDERFSEDALRIMRAVRFAAQLSFSIDEPTYQAIKSHAENLSHVSMERIRVEFEKTILSDNPGFVNLYEELGLGKYIVRSAQDSLHQKCFLADSVPLYQEFGKTENAEEHSLRCLRLAAFFEKIAPDEAEAVLKDLTYDNRTKLTVKKILLYKDWNIPPDKRYIKRALCEMGEDILSLVWEYKLAERRADHGVRAGEARCFEMRDEEMLSDAVELTEEVIKSGEPYKISMLDIDGNDIINSGISPGIAVGKALSMLLDKVICDPSLNKRETLLKMIQEEQA